MSDRPVRPDTLSPARSTESAGNAVPERPPRSRPKQPRPGLNPRRPRPNPSAGTNGAVSLRYISTTVLVGLLVLVTLWGDRANPSPVAGFGVLDVRGRVAITTAGTLTVGQPAPNFRLTDTEGDPVELSDFQGEPVVLQFWTSWCLDCVDAIPIFQQVVNSHSETVTVLGVAPGESSGRISGALNRAGATYLTLLDETEAVSEHYGALPPPLTVVVDSAGNVAAIHAGRVSVAQLEANLEPLLP